MGNPMHLNIEHHGNRLRRYSFFNFESFSDGRHVQSTCLVRVSKSPRLGLVVIFNKSLISNRHWNSPERVCL